MKMTLKEAAIALKSVGDLNGAEDFVVSRIQTDSRLIKPGDLFVCLCGQRIDGHGFAEQAAENGAAAIVSHQMMSEMTVPVLLVEDTLKALGRLGRYWRLKKGKRVIAVTGSAGKTTTKEMLSDILGTAFKVGRNYLNWNNQIGLPLSILKFDGEEDFWVLELGINNPTDMDELGEIACPDQAVILNIGPCHLQGLGTVEGVARAKAKILDHLQEPGKAYVCGDYPLLKQEVEARPDIKHVWFSCLDNPADYSLQHQGAGGFRIQENGESFTVDLIPGGYHCCENIGAVWAVARQWGMEPGQIIKGLEKLCLPKQRFAVQEEGSWTIIDDTYNANPLSMSRAVHSARILAGHKDLFLVIGDMAELGESEGRAHLDLGREISGTGCAGVFFHGKNAENVRAGLNHKSGECFFEITGKESFKSVLNNLDRKGGVVLFKGSRSTGMEKFVGYFREWIAES